jgi:glycosyltransferase involved in cell wall biosynthesis
MGVIKILELDSSKGWGGQEKRTARLVNRLGEGFKVYWGVNPDSELYRRRKEIAGEFIPVKLEKSYNLGTILKLVSLVKSAHIDIISTHSGKDGWIGTIVGKLAGVKVVRTRHLFHPIRSPLSYNLADRVVAVSRKVAQRLVEGGVKKEKVKVIYTGIDTDRFRPRPTRFREEIGVGSDEVLVGIVSVLRSAKRHEDLIRAVAPLPVKLVIVGDGPKRGELERLVAELGIGDKVIFTGERGDVEKVYPALDIAVLPSRSEALGTMLLEAQACEVPVIGSRVGGIPEAVLEGETGLLFEPGNIEELRKKIEELAQDRERRKEMGHKGRQWVIAHFSVDKMVEATKLLYRDLLKGRDGK